MRAALCVPDAALREQLVRLIARYREEWGAAIELRAYPSEIAFLCDAAPGCYDAIFFASKQPEPFVDEVRQKDKRVRLVQVDAPGDRWNPQLWYCLTAPLGEGFLFPVLDKLLREVRREGQSGILVKNRGAVHHLALGDIEFVEAMSRSVFFHTADGKAIEGAASFYEYERQLLQWPDFIKPHRSYIVNLRYVRLLTASGVELPGGKTLPVSRLLYSELRKSYLCHLCDPGEVAPPPPAPVSGEVYRLLLVDDEPAMLDQWGALLEKKGCQVVCASDGKTALTLAAQGRYHCVLLDVLLGEERGFSLCQALRELTGAPVVFLSSCIDPASQMEGFAAGGIDYITKDTPDQLVWAKVEARIRFSKAEREELRFGPLCINLTGRQASMDGVPLTLTTVEFDLLCLLAERPGMVVTPGEIYRGLWGEEPDGDGHAVQMQMSRLRRKLGDGGCAHEFIETVWGEGYRFRPQD